MLNYWVRSLSARLWLTSIVALAVSLTAIAALVIYAFDHLPPQQMQHDADMRIARRVVVGLSFDESGRPAAVRLNEQSAWLFKMAPTELMYRILDARGRVVLASREDKPFAPWLAGDPSEALGEARTTMLGDRQFNIVTLAAKHGDEQFLVQTATSAAFDKAVLAQKVRPIPYIVQYTLLIATVVFGFTLTFTVRRVLRPLREASQAAASITPRNLKTRLPDKGVPSEIKPLINAFNDALERLERGYIVQQQFLAAAAHELQTPLTLIRGQIELQPGLESKELIYLEIDLMARQVRQLLHLAEVSESQNYNFTEVDRLKVAEDVVHYLEHRAAIGQVRLHIEAPFDLPSINADESALFILLKNLVENAISVTPTQGYVSMIFDDGSIAVSDEGPGIRPEYLPFLFTRFWRAPDAKHEGAGLGLAICKEIAGVHGWRLTVRRQSRGSLFVVWFS